MALVLGLAATLAAGCWVNGKARAEGEIRFGFQAAEVERHIAERMHAFEQLLRGGAALFSASEAVEREEWRAYVAGIDVRASYPGIQGMGFSVLVPAGDREEHVRRVRAQGFPDYRIRPEGERGEYTSIIYLEPFDWRNRRAFGFDMFSEPIRRAAMEQARDSGATALSGKVILVQETETDVQAGMLMYVPVYRRDLPVTTPEERRIALVGYVYAPFRMNDLMGGILGNARLDLAIYDGEVMVPQALLYDSDPARTCRDPAQDQGFRRTATLSISGHPWTLCLAALPAFEARSLAYGEALPVLVGGSVISLLWAGILWLLLNTRARARVMAQGMTQALRESEERYGAIVAQVADAIVLIDPQTLRFAEFNQAACMGLRYSRDEFAALNLADIQAEPLTFDQVRERTERVVAGREAQDFEWVHRCKDGSLRDFWISNRTIELRGRQYLAAIWHDITERKRAAEALRAASLYARNLIEASLDPLVTIDAEGKITDVNRATEEATGRSREVLISSDFCDCFTDPEQARAGYQKVFAEGLVRDYPLAIAHASGRVIDVLYHAVLFRNGAGEVQGVFAAARDITERKRLEERLRKLSLAVEQSPESIVITGLNARIEYVNEAFVQNTGYSRAEAQGQNPRILKSGKTPPETYQALWDTLIRGRTWRGEFINRRKNGEEYAEFAVITPIRRPDGAVSHYVAVKEDITRSKAVARELDQYRQHLEELVAERTLELAAAKAAAEQANQAKSLFLANMSHDIRTPMTAVMGMTELCLTTNPSERQRNYLTKIRSACDGLLHVIDDILDFSKIEAGKLDLVEESFTPAAVLDCLVSMLTNRAQDRGLELVTRMDPALAGRAFLGDPRRLGQVLINLVGNAIKFSQQGQVAVGVTEESRSEDRVVLHFEIQDQGIGISPQDQAHLFHPFTQADASTTRNFGGTGLGLAISRRLVELMGGRIWVDSAPGRGSTFHFTASLGITERAPVALASHGARRADAAALDRLRGADVLLVEDAELNQEVMRDVLEQAGLRVRLAVNGVQALDAVAKTRPDCVLMDCQMPVMDGFEATRRLRALGPYADLPIIALTANAMAGDRERCLAAGMNGFVAKPVDFENLFAALARWVQTGPRTPDAAPLPALTSGTEPGGDGLSELPGIDTAAGLALTGGRPDFYIKMLRKFRDNRADDCLAHVREAQRAGDWVAATRVAHTLKGASRTLGAGALGELAAGLEAAARQGRAEEIARHLAAVEQELGRVMAGLARLGEAGAAPAIPSVPTPS